MFLVNATKIVKDDKGNVTHRIPFQKYVLENGELNIRENETAQEHSARVCTLIDAVKIQLVDIGWNGRTDYILDVSDNGDGSQYDDCKSTDTGCVTVKCPGIEGAVNNGIDLAIRAAVMPKKMSAKQVVENNRKLALAWAAKHAGTNPEFMTEFVGKIASGSDVAADWVLSSHKAEIDGLL